MDTNSVKILIVQVNPFTGHFITLERRKKLVLLGMDSTPTISDASILRSTLILHKFLDILISRRVPPGHSRLVATSAIRESAYKSQFIHLIHETLGLRVDVLSGSDEAHLTYLGVLQFHPVHNNMILTVDIGGGSTEFVIRHQDLVSQVNKYNVEKVIGSSGTIRKIEKAVYNGYT
ncbi:phosphatase [Lithospermum erythrorhizon]|uniref:Phosphatase n=1 Tax=Lithospermum erythrorhizon TaxID=34254 RepID=A0AAV3RU08_LITER